MFVSDRSFQSLRFQMGPFSFEFVSDRSFKFPRFQITTKKTKISEGNLVRENVESLSNSVTKFCDQEICEEFQFFRH